MNLARMIDHTNLKPDATEVDIDQLIAEAKKYEFRTVCLNPWWVKKASEALEDTSVGVCTVIGFPLGATTTENKVAETMQAIMNGADEVDMVINIGELKAGHDDVVLEDIRAVAEITHQNHKVLKVIIEACLLTDDEKVRACELCEKAGADFVKTSTGFSTGGATVEDVALMRQTVSEGIQVKAAGGIRTKENALAMIQAGADRIGASASIAIINE